MKKLAIIGASYLQIPLIEKAREMCTETHVFAWAHGSEPGRDCCDQYYPVSITEKEKILEICECIQINGIISIGSDLAMPTVNFVADRMNLYGNSLECTLFTTNKYAMRVKLSENNLPCPKFQKITSVNHSTEGLVFPLIVKPTDRSGSRGISKINDENKLSNAIRTALSESIAKEAIIEEFIEGKEISVEMISWQGTHHLITFTDKVSTGEPYFVEIEQHVPADLSPSLSSRIVSLVKEALTVLGVEYGASHTELLITKEEEIFIVEIGARMGGDNIGSDLVQLSTGYDFVRGIIGVALGEFKMPEIGQLKHSGIIYITPKSGRVTAIKNNVVYFQEIIRSNILVNIDDQINYPVTDSSQRSAFFIYASDKMISINPEEVICIHTE